MVIMMDKIISILLNSTYHAIQVKGDGWLLRDQGRSENPFITRNKRYELVERVPLRKHAISQYAVLQIRNKLCIPKNTN